MPTFSARRRYRPSVMRAGIAEFRLFKELTGGSCRTTTSFTTGVNIAPGAGVGTFRTLSEFVNDGWHGRARLGPGRLQPDQDSQRVGSWPDHHVSPRKLTSRHPLIKASGEVVWASKLVKGDKVMTDRGIATIVSADRVEYTGQVFNLKLGTDEERAKVGKNGTTMFAGGFLAGDSAMQQDHEKKIREVAQVPSKWQRDYRNAMSNNPPIQRILR